MLAAQNGNMEKTGAIDQFALNAVETQRATQGATSLRRRLSGGLAGLVVLAAAALPITIGQTSFLPEFQSARAAASEAGGNEDGGGDGQGNGQGNGKGQGGIHRKIGNGDDGDTDSGGGGIDDEDHGAGPGGTGNDRDPGGFGNIGEADAANAIAAVDDIPPAGPVDTPVAALPTIQQIFSMDDRSILNADQELQAIQNGWGGPPSE